ncbi:MAG: hypothetical protein J6K48_09425 [Lachnospiraceae bacterium]|nr:hypothetical protein [Lachnospiraceae bacterium]
MVGVFILTVIIVGIIYLYMRRKSKKNPASEINTVQDYHASYDRIRTRKELRDKENAYQTYITKYNSSEDYREKF